MTTKQAAQRLATTAAIALVAALPAAAQDTARSAADRDRPWIISLSGGLTAVQAQADQPFGALGLTRNFGDSWVKADVTYVGSGSARGLTIPADTWIGGFAAGTYLGSLGLEAHVSAGRRQFDAASVRTQAGTAIAVDRSGGIFGLGGSISYDVPLADGLFITPFVGVDYNQIDFVVALTGPGGRPVSSQQQSNDGVTGSAGATFTDMFTRQRQRQPVGHDQHGQQYRSGWPGWCRPAHHGGHAAFCRCAPPIRDLG